MAIVDAARLVLEGQRKAAAGPLVINRYDNDTGGIDYQLQQDGPPGDVLCGFSEDDCKRAKPTAQYVSDVYVIAPDLAACVLLVDEVTRDLQPAIQGDRYASGQAYAVREIRRRLGLVTP